jgi:prepilin-type N-terminal cleavage/methylation domain-containing protein
MSLRFFQRLRSSKAGFSLVEMLVAMMFIGILSAGMMRIYSTNLAGFQRVNDTIGSQRRGRWALTTLQDDVASIGFFAFVGFNTPLSGNFSTDSTGQEPFMVLPGPTQVKLAGPDPANPGGPPLPLTALPVNPDELQYVSDISLPVQATLTGTSITGLTLDPKIIGDISDIQPGDIVAILDNQFEQFYILSVAGTVVTADLTKTSNFKNWGGIYHVGEPGTKVHSVGTPVAFYRPSVVTRYSVQAQSWDPSNAAITIPCLVRQQAPYPTGGTTKVDWTAGPPAVTTAVIAENIEGFRVDLTFDGGKTWLRAGVPVADTGSTGWGDLAAMITTALAPLGATTEPRNTYNPLWFRSYPFLIRLDVTSRSPAPRSTGTNAQTGAVGPADYVRRTQTLLVTPRNSGFSL